jgi:NAD-dependent deacetylase
MDAPSPLPANWRPPPGPVFVLSGAGLSAASGIGTFRGPGGLWEGQRADELATPRAFRDDPDRVRRFYDARRAVVLAATPNPGHLALLRLQAAWGRERVHLVTQNVDGLFDVAADPTRNRTIEMHGSLLRLRCASDEDHPVVSPWPGAATAEQDPDVGCAVCGARLRPDVVWFGEVPDHVLLIHRLAIASRTFLSVGTSGVVYPAAGLVDKARQGGAVCIEVNPEPAGGAFHYVVAAPAETALPGLVDQWLGAA